MKLGQWAGCLGLVFMLLLTSCSTNNVNKVSPDKVIHDAPEKSASPSPTVVISSMPSKTPDPLPTLSGESPKPDPAKAATGFIICIDPGHQERANDDLEADGPGSKTQKPKVSSGTQGIMTKKPEYMLNLEVSLLLKEKLIAKGYQVVMTRETSQVNLSNKDRADIANKAHADLFVRIHADGNELHSIHGISIQYPAEHTPFASDVYKPSKSAAADIIDAMAKATRTASRGIVPSSDLSGFNWAKVPSILVEMGFMTNAEEDTLMSKPEYQEKLAVGMTNGIDRWFAERG